MSNETVKDRKYTLADRLEGVAMTLEFCGASPGAAIVREGIAANKELAEALDGLFTLDTKTMAYDEISKRSNAAASALAKYRSQA